MPGILPLSFRAFGAFLVPTAAGDVLRYRAKPDANVFEPRRLHGHRIESVPAVEYEPWWGHIAADSGRVGFGNLAPFGHDHSSLRSGSGGQYICSDLQDIREKRTLTIPKARIIDRQLGSLRCKRLGQFHRGSLGQVVGLRLEG